MSDLAFRTERMADFFVKHHVEGLPEPLVIHHFTGTDGGDPHDHPWAFKTTILFGGYDELVYPPSGHPYLRRHREGDHFQVEPEHVHLIVALPEGQCVTCIRPIGPKVREPGFYQWRDGRPFRRAWNEPDYTPYLF